MQTAGSRISLIILISSMYRCIGVSVYVYNVMYKGIKKDKEVVLKMKNDNDGSIYVLYLSKFKYSIFLFADSARFYFWIIFYPSTSQPVYQNYRERSRGRGSRGGRGGRGVEGEGEG